MKVISMVTLAFAGANVVAQHLPLPELPYAYDALEPYIDETTMRVHHLKHHQAYTDKTNTVLAKLRSDPEQKHLAKKGIDTLLTELENIADEADRETLRNNGGGYVNHDLFWRIMSPNGGLDSLDPISPLATAIEETFGSVGAFETQFSTRGQTLFGSGWVWLYVDVTVENPSLVLTTTSNQNTPAMTAGHVPILCLDVWEHAYYLQYKNNRVEYIKRWWNVVNWPEVEARYKAAVNKVKTTAKSEL